VRSDENADWFAYDFGNAFSGNAECLAFGFSWWHRVDFVSEKERKTLPEMNATLQLYDKHPTRRARNKRHAASSTFSPNSRSGARGKLDVFARVARISAAAAGVFESESGTDCDAPSSADSSGAFRAAASAVAVARVGVAPLGASAGTETAAAAASAAETAAAAAAEEHSSPDSSSDEEESSPLGPRDAARNAIRARSSDFVASAHADIAASFARSMSDRADSNTTAKASFRFSSKRFFFSDLAAFFAARAASEKAFSKSELATFARDATASS